MKRSLADRCAVFERLSIVAVPVAGEVRAGAAAAGSAVWDAAMSLIPAAHDIGFRRPLTSLANRFASEPFGSATSR